MNLLKYFLLPVRTAVLLFLAVAAYWLGYGIPHEEWRKDSPVAGLSARYTRNGRPWRIFYDRDRNHQWDMWIDERAGHPHIVSIDDNGDGKPDRAEDEWGNPLSAWQLAKLQAYKTLMEFLHNRLQLLYSFLALLIYGLLELIVRYCWATTV
jgi:hypothetical protein